MNKPWMVGCTATIAIAFPAVAGAQGAYLFVWAGGPSGNEVLATIDASPTSPTYGRVLASASV